MYTNNEIALMKLTHVYNLSSRQKVMLLSFVEEPYQLWENLGKLAQRINLVTPNLYDKLSALADKFCENRMLEYMEDKNVCAIFPYSKCYPNLLSQIPDAPLLLYVKGDKLLLTSECIAVVGTRTPTRYGKDVTEQFSTQLAAGGFTIVSGLARGVDSIAHQSALQQDRPTIAVVGCGLDKVYPAENKGLFDKIAQEGAIISEYAFGESAMPYHFPERNRIISAISAGVIVTEAGIKSGSMITVGYALEQGKDVFLVPGNIYSKASEGTNEMLKNPQCYIACSPADILEFYKKEAVLGVQNEYQMDANEAIVYAEISMEERHFEELLMITKLSMSELFSTLTKLEIVGVIKKLPGNYYSI